MAAVKQEVDTATRMLDIAERLVQVRGFKAAQFKPTQFKL